MKKLGIVLCVLWIGFIFYNSSQPAIISGGVTENFVNSIKEVVKGEGDELENTDVSYNNVSSSFKDMAKSVLITVKTRIKVWKNTSITTRVHNFIRKLAHGLEFFVLAILVIFILSKGNINNKDLIVRTLFIVVMAALLDEYLQGYIPGRGSSVSDVLIDFWGGVFGVLIFKGVSKIFCKTEEKTIREKDLEIRRR